MLDLLGFLWMETPGNLFETAQQRDYRLMVQANNGDPYAMRRIQHLDRQEGYRRDNQGRLVKMRRGKDGRLYPDYGAREAHVRENMGGPRRT